MRKTTFTFILALVVAMLGSFTASAQGPACNDNVQKPLNEDCDVRVSLDDVTEDLRDGARKWDLEIYDKIYGEDNEPDNYANAAGTFDYAVFRDGDFYCGGHS